jgi:broad specificity phosphatase PhoE
MMLALASALFLAPGRPAPAATPAAESAWAALAAGGHAALMRHASAPGSGDPPGFRLDDCTTQRNLSADGRAEAELIGGMLRGRGLRVDAVYSSQWCRCLETARLLDVAPVVPLPLLNSFFRDPAQGALQMGDLKAWLRALRPVGTVVLVTHQGVITALTGIVPAEGEIVVIRPADGGEAVVGRIPPP